MNSSADIDGKLVKAPFKVGVSLFPPRKLSPEALNYKKATENLSELRASAPKASPAKFAPLDPKLIAEYEAKQKAKEVKEKPESKKQEEDLQSWALSKRARSEKSDWQIQANNLSRWYDDQRFVGGLAQMASAEADYNRTHEDTDSNVVSAETQVETLIGSGVGLVMGTILHWMLRKRYPNKRSLNPIFRTFKTLACTGATFGSMIGYLLPLPKNSQKIASTILADIFSFVFGLVSLPYWLVREYVLTTPMEERNKYARTGAEGWSKYGKTLLVFGVALGQALGALHSCLAGTDLMTSIAIGGGISGVAAFFSGLILIPLVNRFCGNAFITDKNTFRNNYVRSGIVAGSSLGSAIGFIMGTVLFPGLGSLAGMAIGGAIGSLIGGVVVGVNGKKISKKIHPDSFGFTPEASKDNENSWDYVTRSTAYMGASLGAVIGFFVPVPGGALVGAALGAAIGATVGWVSGFGVLKAARAINPVETPANSLPWTQRVATGSNVFSVVGGIVGCIAGFCLLGPVGALLGAALGFAIGGVVGSIVGIFYDPKDKQAKAPPSEVELTSLPTPRLSRQQKQLELKSKHDVTPSVTVAVEPSSLPAPVMSVTAMLDPTPEAKKKSTHSHLFDTLTKSKDTPDMKKSYQDDIFGDVEEKIEREKSRRKSGRLSKQKLSASSKRVSQLFDNENNNLPVKEVKVTHRAPPVSAVRAVMV
jgi:hypothetical protein